MHFSILTLFPEIFESYLAVGVVGRGVQQKHISYDLIQIRDFAQDKHKSVDDHPYGGGAGMVMRPDVLFYALEEAFRRIGVSLESYDRSKVRVVLMSASGITYTQSVAKSYAKLEHIVLICGRYEGIDQRYIDLYCDEEINIGNFVVSGGELPALIVVDSVARMVDGVLGNPESLEQESHSTADYIEHPHYTRPEKFKALRVPEVLLKGNHSEIAKWREQQSLERKSKR